MFVTWVYDYAYADAIMDEGVYPRDVFAEIWKPVMNMTEEDVGESFAQDVLQERHAFHVNYALGLARLNNNVPGMERAKERRNTYVDMILYYGQSCWNSLYNHERTAHDNKEIFSSDRVIVVMQPLRDLPKGLQMLCGL